MPGMQPRVLEDVRILFRNFSGEEGRFNAKGKRNFNIALTEDLARAMIKEGWNVKYLDAREEGDEPQAVIKVNVQFGSRPPKVVLVTSRGKTPLNEHTVGLLDWATIVKVDCIIRPYEWEVNQKTGVTAYLNTLFATIQEDALEMKYADLEDAPDSALSALGGEQE